MEEPEFSRHGETPENLKKISSNEFANVVLLTMVLVVVLLTLIPIAQASACASPSLKARTPTPAMGWDS